MMRLLALCALSVALCACAPLTLYHKPGVAVSRMSSDQLSCETRALREAPVAQHVRQTAPVFVPPRQTCDASGACVTYGGYWRPGQIYTVDVNASLRKRVEQSCMQRAGYAEVSIPRCAAGLRASGATAILPVLTPRSCAIRNPDGSVAIVDAP